MTINIKKQIHNLTSEEVLKRFNTSFAGLSDEEAKKRRREYGPNKIQKKASWKWLRIIANQFKDILVWILLVACGLALLFQEYRDVAVILAIVGINALIGFIQEFRAERILDAIKNLTTDKTFVLRNGKKKEINTEDLVPGDVVFIYSGDKVPADGYLLESYDLKVNSFIFTGESVAETKAAGVMAKTDVALADITNMVFMGETVAVGEANFLVTGTGMNTSLGKIAELTHGIKEDATPLQRQMRRLGKDIAVASVLIGIVVMIAGQYFRMSLYENFIFALALAVSVVPEGLPAAILVALSLGMKRLLKNNVLVKRLNAVETLGSVSIICTDKTGTITKNEMTVTQVVVNGETYGISGVGYAPEGQFQLKGQFVDLKKIKNLELLFKIGTLCNDADLVRKKGQYAIMGDPTEGALIVAGRKYNNAENFYSAGEFKLAEKTFSSERMRMSVIFRNHSTVSYVKGSPDVMLEICDYVKIGDEIRSFSPEEKNAVRKTYDAMSQRALRVLAFAYRELDVHLTLEEMENLAEKKLVWVGMMAMIDPPREGTPSAIAECKNAGIKVIMITGDYEITARAIAKNIGLIKNEKAVISGTELEKLTDREIYQKIKSGVAVFARIAPEQKLRIAVILKNNGQVIAMTGDGVNDAPALKKADIGVAMGVIGTDVSKEAADMILLDDNFAAIVTGIKEGRTIFQNLKKFIHYVLTSNASELFSVVFGVILQIPAPITAIQILSIDLATDVFPSFSLGLEPPEPGVNAGKVANHKKKVMTWKGFRRIVYLGIAMAAGGVAAFIWSMLRGGWNFGEDILVDSALYMKSTTATYAVLALTQMANLLQSRSEKYSPFKLGFFKNKYAIGSIFISVGILLLFMYLPFFQEYLRMAPIDGKDWLAAFIATVAVFLLEEARKAEETGKIKR